MAEKESEGDLKLKLGMRFVPTDEELVFSYLKPKISGKTLHSYKQLLVKEFTLEEVYSSAPSADKLNAYGVKSFNQRKACFFFTKKSEEHNTDYGSIREISNGKGYWKVVTSKENVHDSRGRICAYKSKLAFYYTRQRKGTSDGPQRRVRSNWIMEEYQLAEAYLSAKLAKNNVYILGKISQAVIAKN